MRKIILSLFAGAFTCLVNGQIAVTGISPASVQGNYNFTIGDATQSWAPALDFSTPGVFVQGDLAIVDDGSSGTNPQGNPVSAEGCNTLVNAAAVNGKIAVIYRNTCNFGVKALNAQNAGAIAVIILNRDPEVIGMNGGTEGLNVTIPVVMLSNLDGQILTNAMQGGPVKVFIGNKAGLYPNDLALSEELIAVPQYHGMHALLAENGSEFNVDLGLRVYNFGAATQTNAMANVTITGPSGTEVYNEDVTFTLNGVSGNTIDSVEIFPEETLNFPQFSLATYPAGKYTLTYTLINGGGVDDDFPDDNTYTIDLFIGNKTGAFQNDLSLNQDLVMTPPYHGVHSLLAQNGTEFNFDLGLRVYNFGGSNQSNATVNATVTNPSGTAVYDEDITISLNQGDSVDIFPEETNAFPQFSLSTYPAGEYTVTYTISLDGVADDFASDNTYTATFVVNDSYLSRARLDENTLKPITMSQVKPAAPTSGGTYSEVVYCSSFRNSNASRLAALGFNATVSVDSVDASSTLEGKFAFAELYEWTNADAVYAANLANTTLAYTLNAVGTVDYTFENNVLKEEVYFEFPTPVVLQDDVMYLACITDFGQELNIGYDRGINFNATRQLLEEWINPLKVVEGQTVTWYGAGFGPDMTPSFGIRAIDATTVAVENLVSLEGKAYPNPTDDVITMNIPLDGKATISVTDLSGRTVADREVTFMGNQASIDLAELQSGMYVINVAYDNGSKSAFNVVKK